ncbi:hypothetical protein LZL87_010921 [Fusarium oxysporum]|nr:hypothetical protein LZL87_010921 [Fusarium oxysporum]
MDRLFSTAETTVLYFDDVSPNVVNELYKDKRTPERLSSVISACKSKYFKRVWTAMEFIKSERVRMMISNYTYFTDLDDPAFLGQVFKAWKNEVRQHEKVHDLERKVQMGKNQVPWSLVLEIDGPDVRDFIAALGTTHPGNVSTTMEILEEKNEVNHLQRVLNKLYNSPEIPAWPTEGKDNIKWLADVLSFSKLRLGDDQTVLGDNAARMLAHKVGSFVLPTELLNARAYRIPGLKYLCSEKDGLAILVQEDRIVGRMIWATPACACRNTGTVTLRIPEFFLPSAFSIN